MGLVLRPAEIKSGAAQVRANIESTRESYSGALGVVQAFSQNEALKSESWDTAKNNIFEAHQAIVQGMSAAQDIIANDLSILEANAGGSEDLDEDTLNDQIQKLTMECILYEEMIKRLMMVQSSTILGTNPIISKLIYHYRLMLKNTQLQLYIVKFKLQSLIDKENMTATLFQSVETLLQAVQCAIDDAEVYITGEGQISDGNWKVIIPQTVDNLVYVQLINEQVFTDLGIDLEKFKSAYGEDALKEVQQCMIDFDIKDKTSIAMFLATMTIESGYGTKILEVGRGSQDYTEAVKGAGMLQITGETQQTFLEHVIKTETDPELLNKAKQYYNGFVMYNGKTCRDNNIVIDNQSCAEFIANEYPIYSSVWFWKECHTFYYSSKSKESMDDFIVRMGDKAANRDNLFLFVQMKHNGTNYGGDALERFCQYSGDAVVTKGCYSNVPREHSTGYCFTILDEQDRHDNGPYHWDERKAAWDAVKGKIDE